MLKLPKKIPPEKYFKSLSAVFNKVCLLQVKKYIFLQEQRTHIDVLDSALSTAQSNVLKLEEEVRQKEVYVERVKQMTKSLEQLQVGKKKKSCY